MTWYKLDFPERKCPTHTRKSVFSVENQLTAAQVYTGTRHKYSTPLMWFCGCIHAAVLQVCVGGAFRQKVCENERIWSHRGVHPARPTRSANVDISLFKKMMDPNDNENYEGNEV